MATHFHLSIIVLRIAHMRKVECLSKRFDCMRHGNEVYVVCHQTIGKYFELIVFAMTLDEGQILITICIVRKYVLLIIAPLCYVVWIA